jgi:hypothetical protein
MALSDDYPQASLVHSRVPQVKGTPRGWSIVPVPGPAVEPPERVHHNSAVVVSTEPGTAFVMEWTDNRVELHRVNL